MINPHQKQGFLLTRQQVTDKGALKLVYWLATDDGPHCVEVLGESFIFFVPKTQCDDLLSRLSTAGIDSQNKDVALKTFDHQWVSAFYFSNSGHFFNAIDIAKKTGIETYEADIRPVDRYLMERSVLGSADFIGDAVNHSKTTQAKLKSSSYEPSLRMVSFDIECSMAGEAYSIGAYTDDAQWVWMIGDETPEKNQEFIVYVRDRKHLLNEFLDFIRQYDPDVLIGWNCINFDLRLLQKWCDEESMPFAIGRGGEAVQWRNHPSNNNHYFTLIPGRAVLDGIDTLKTATYHFAKYSLDFVSRALLADQKLVDDNDNRASHIQWQFHNDKAGLAKYNLHDCKLVWDIFRKCELLEFAIKRTQLTGLEIDRVGGSVAAFTNLYLPKLHRQGYVAPNMGRPEDYLPSPGGYVMDSTPGLFNNILVLDFKSLYPSIIRTFFIDPMGMIEGLAHPEPKTSVPGFNDAHFSRTQHILPQLIKDLWQARDKAKQEKNGPLSQAIKIIMNSFYGVLGSNGCRFYDQRLASSITKRGHQIMQLTKEWIEQMGHNVIYGDTDSTFVHVTVENGQNISEIGASLAEAMNLKWRDYLFDEYGVDSQLELEFETHFSQFHMPTIRGKEQGSKKRYAGVVEDNGQSRLIFKGMENVRTDWSELAKSFQYTLYEKVFAKEETDDYVKEVVCQLYAARMDDKLVYQKKLRQPLEEYQKTTPPHVKAGRFLQQLSKKDDMVVVPQKGDVIEYVITVNGPEPNGYVTSSIDYDHYLAKQLAPVADAILPHVGKSFESLCNQQMSLFD